MSELLNSGMVGRSMKETTNYEIMKLWENSGLVEGLDGEIRIKVAIALELAAMMLIAESNMADMHFKSTGEIVDEDDNRFDTVIFPIIRRIISRSEETHKYIPEIIGLARKEYNTVLWKAIMDENESAMIHFYDNVLPLWSEYHKNREHKTYDEAKRHLYEKHVKRYQQGGYGTTIESYEDFIPMDWEAEFAAHTAEKIESIINEHIKNNNETDIL